ncbi:PREDICTED: coiled-coil domain-containing protein 87 [Gekko japonicus]|uniref:Coiled-coil domain-containing protein 87 n=1 Tax=Gekko japonicus TaxID=146911 RepID=A0ABM1K110_GEKJA|nr:PREDICTED: coiled-coil domain-containing protein 87 [Gekko japonicus]
MAPSRLPSDRGLYALEDTEQATQKLHSLYQRVLAPLSLFPATHSRLKVPVLKRASSYSPSVQKPVVPLSQAALTQLVKGRLELEPQWENVCPRAQSVFQEIILAEVKHIWKDAQHSLYDPAFSPQMNREIYQNLVAYIGLVCQHLYLHYLCLMEHCRVLGVFTDCANLTRFAAQLSLDCSTFLKVSAVRHRLVMDMKTSQNHYPEPILRSLYKQTSSHPSGCRLRFTISHFIKLIRPHMPTLRQKIAKDIKELEDLPPLDLRKIKHLLPVLRPAVPMRQMSCAAITTPCPPIPGPGAKTKRERAHQPVPLVKRSKSLPNMRVGQLLADELGISLVIRPLTPDLPTHYAEPTEDGELKVSKNLAEDLRRLVQGSVLKSSQRRAELDEESELPPLIKALTWRKSNEVRCEQLQRILCSLQQEQVSEEQQRDTIISAPASHPQAATMNLTVHNRVVVKAADLQVSERTYHETVAMNKYTAVYNHLLGEIDIASTKALDANIFAGEDVKKIYMELMNTVPKDHQKFDAGPLIDHPATDIELSTCFASSTLTRRKSEQVINKELSQILPAGPFILEEVIDTPTTPNLPFKKNLSQKRRASWLRWWKTTFNTDDYLTYISTKDSDYLQVVFHLYDYDREEEEEEEEEEHPILDEGERKKQEEVKREERKKAAELQSEKEEYQSGEWNFNTILMGGLGTFIGYDHKPEDLKVLQRRLERLWTVLHFTEQERLDMAIKYSSKRYYLLLPDMLQSWEIAAQCIQDRELLLSELESFEQTASDPNRFFSRATRSVVLRMKESRIRSRLYSELSSCDSELCVILNHIKETFNDIVTFKGRPYLEKMEWDIVEMLYWLQQERRASNLKKVVQRGREWWELPPLT